MATLKKSEQAYILESPEALLLLMDYHDEPQEWANSMDAGCYGDILRREELRQLGAEIIARDPDIWQERIKIHFAEPVGYRAKELAHAQRMIRDQYENTI